MANNKEVKENQVNQTPTDLDPNGTFTGEEGDKKVKKEFFLIRGAKWIGNTVSGIAKKHPTATKAAGFTMLTLGTIMTYDAYKDWKRQNYATIPMGKSEPIDTTFTPVPEVTTDPINPVATTDVFEMANGQVFDNNGVEVTNF